MTNVKVYYYNHENNEGNNIVKGLRSLFFKSLIKIINYLVLTNTNGLKSHRKHLLKSSKLLGFKFCF